MSKIKVGDYIKDCGYVLQVLPPGMTTDLMVKVFNKDANSPYTMRVGLFDIVDKKKKRAKVLIDQRPDDGYTHYGVITATNVWISAGCRKFTTLKSARKHWRNQNRPHETPEENRKLNAWSLKFIDRLEKMRFK